MKKKFIGLLLVLVLLSVIGYSYIALYPTTSKATEDQHKIQVTERYNQISNENQNDNIILEYQEKFANSDIIGELSIPNTSLKVPIAQSDDNEYYLNHLLDKSYNTLGSVFLDYRNQITDKKIIIYGHNSQNVSTEFHLLEQYLDATFYQAHQDIFLQTLDNLYHYKIFSVYI